MSNEAAKIASSGPMWIAAGIAILLVLVQAYLFLKKTYITGKRIGLSENQMKSAMKSSGITAIGPSVVILTGLLSLLITVGGPMAWMRLSFIGSVMFESMAAGFGAEAVGVTLGEDVMTEMAFANAVWTMTLGSIGWIIFGTFSADKMEKVQKKFSGKDPGLMKIISVAAMLGSFGALSSSYILKLNSGTIAWLGGGFIMLVLSPLADRAGIKWLREWALAIALFGGMIIGAVASQSGI